MCCISVSHVHVWHLATSTASPLSPSLGNSFCFTCTCIVPLSVVLLNGISMHTTRSLSMYAPVLRWHFFVFSFLHIYSPSLWQLFAYSIIEQPVQMRLMSREKEKTLEWMLRTGNDTECTDRALVRCTLPDLKQCKWPVLKMLLFSCCAQTIAFLWLITYSEDI